MAESGSWWLLLCGFGVGVCSWVGLGVEGVQSGLVAAGQGWVIGFGGGAFGMIVAKNSSIKLSRNTEKTGSTKSMLPYGLSQTNTHSTSCDSSEHALAHLAEACFIFYCSRVVLDNTSPVQ